jgi:hypothetical protein
MAAWCPPARVFLTWLASVEPLDVAAQGLGVTAVQLADGGIGVGGQLAAGSIRDGRTKDRHNY